MKPTMIFHHPYPVSPEGESGSSVRPFKMIKAFESIGYEVELVAGYGLERKKAIKTIKRAVKLGKKYDFIYSESSTMPTLLTEANHYPTFPFLDFGFFRWAKRNLIPLGLFYRDIYWLFPMYANDVSWYKRAISIPLYKYDWMIYRCLLDHLFLPSIKMKEALPTAWINKGISALPPGCDSGLEDGIRIHSTSNNLKLFYVGGVTPPGYNLRPLFQTADSLKGVHLTLCCREQEWKAIREYDCFTDKGNVSIIHVNGSELHAYYETVDIFTMLREPHEYLDFAMPVKVFESIAHGIPILTLSGTEAARFIMQEDIGWVVDTVDEARRLLLHLLEYREEIAIKKERVCKVRKDHTWEARAKTAARTLMKIKDEFCNENSISGGI